MLSSETPYYNNRLIQELELCSLAAIWSQEGLENSCLFITLPTSPLSQKRHRVIAIYFADTIIPTFIFVSHRLLQFDSFIQ